MEQCLPVGTQEWEYVETEFSSTHFRPLRDVTSLRKKFNILVKKKKIPTGNPTCPPFVRRAKKIFNSLVEKCNISSHGHICNLADNNAMRDTVEESNSNQGNEEEQEDDAEVVVESPNVTSVVDVVDSLPAHDSDAPANLNALPRLAIRSIPSSKKISRKKRVNEDGETDSSSTSQILEMIRLDMQESKRRREEDLEYRRIQAEDRRIQLEEDREERRIQQLRAEDSNARFEQSSQMFLQLLGSLINRQH